MRDFISVVNYAGPMKMKKYAKDEIEPTEEQIICRALREINLPKLVQEDVPFFKLLINDYFSSHESKNIDQKLSESINKFCELNALTTTEAFEQKVQQLKQTLSVRHGCMIVGPSKG
jgi:dynein heavy chain